MSYVKKITLKNNYLTENNFLKYYDMFHDNHTSGFTDIQRAFMMGNALVTGIVSQIGKPLIVLCHVHVYLPLYIEQPFIHLSLED